MVLQTVLDDCLPHLTSIINDSLHFSLFPSPFKLATMKPLLKKTLNPEILNNYRPVSNLSFLSKILEKVVLRQLSNHLLTSNLLFYLHTHSLPHDPVVLTQDPPGTGANLYPSAVMYSLNVTFLFFMSPVRLRWL